MRTIKTVLTSVLVIGAFGIATASNAQDKAPTLDALVKMVEKSRIGETKDQRAREARFRKEKSSQASLLKKAEAEKVAEEQRSAQLEERIKELTKLKEEKSALRKERLGNLNELFGHMTSAAGDLRSNIDSSIVSAQYPNRSQFLNELIEKMNSETKLPTTGELEKLWAEMLKEIVESGKITKFATTVSDVSGNQSEQEVVRIGSYNLMSNGSYLDYNRDNGNLSELSRQPSYNAAAELQSAASGFVKVGIDPTGPAGGQLLKALINTPKLKERFEQGGLVGKVIAGVGALALLIALWRFLALTAVSAKVSSQLRAKKASTSNPLGRVLKVAEDNPGIDTESLELKLEEAVLKEKPSIESMLSTLKIISMVAPLLGLLGTVTGMIVVFQAITIYGAGDPKAMAGGISGALVTTVLGLYVAIPTVLIHTYLSGKAKRVSHVLEEQSAGIVASKSER